MDTSYLQVHIRELDYALSMAVQSYAEINGMIAENQSRISKGESPAYTENDFMDVAVRNGMTHNQSIERHLI